jgi:hypothetical protein
MNRETGTIRCADARAPRPAVVARADLSRPVVALLVVVLVLLITVTGSGNF